MFKPDASPYPQQFILYQAHLIRAYRSSTSNNVIY